MKKIINLLSQFDKNINTKLIDFENFIKTIDFKIDNNFLEIYKMYNGMEGFLNSENFLILWNVSDIIALNPYYEDIEKCEKLFFFGTNGSNLGYAFDKKNGNIVSIDFLDILSNEPDFVSDSFLGFLEKLCG